MRRRRSDEEWAREAEYIDKVDVPGEEFHRDWSVFRRYVEMQLRFCTEDCGPYGAWTCIIRAKHAAIADR